MVLAAAGAGALIGGGLFAWSTTAMAVGWLVGGWLYNTLSESNKGGIDPQEMPQFNRALRGTPIFVTFGANRVWAQIPWAKNWTPHEQSAGGKGGGSGGGGGKGAAGGMGYTYTWDIMYHYGFVDEPCFIRNAWNGGDRVSLENIEEWNLSAGAISGSLTGLVAGLLLQSLSQKSDIAHLESDEVFFAPGYPTGSANLESWSYFTTQENGVRCQWPYTAWLGFKQLNLGSSGVTPQLSVELVPLAGANFGAEPEFISKTTITDVGGSVWSQGAMPSNNMMAVGLDGNRYCFVTANNGTFLVNIDTSAETEITHAMVEGWLTTLSSPLAGALNAGVGHMMVVPGTRFVVNRHVSTSVSHRPSVVILEIDANGALVPLYYKAAICSSLAHGLWQNIVAVAHYNNNLYVCVNDFYTLSVRATTVIKIPLVGNFNDLTGNSWVDNFVHKEMRTPLGDEFFAVANWRGNHLATLFENGTDNVGIVVYVPQSTIEITTGNSVLDALTVPSFLVCNSTTTYTNETDQIAELDDIRLNYAGSSSTNDDDDYGSPNCLQMGDQIYFFWVRPYSDKGEYWRIRICTFDGVDTLTWMVDEQVRVIDTVLRFGVSEGNRDSTYAYDPQFGYDPETGRLIGMGEWFPNITDTQTWIDLGDFAPSAVDVTPPYIIKRILTHPAFGVSVAALFGFSVTEDRIDAASYADVVDFCEINGIKVATTYTNSDNLLGVFESLLALYGGLLPVVGGKIFFTVARDDDDSGRVVDNNHLIFEGKPPVTINDPAIQDSYNQIQYNYIDRALDYKNNQVEISDEVDMDINGPRPKSFPSRYVMAGSLAQRLAEQALWSNLYGRRMYTFKLGWKDADLIPSDVITLVDSFDPKLSAGRKVRLVKKKESKRGVFDTIAVDHIPYHLTANHAFTSTQSLDNPDAYVTDIQPVTFRAYELPKEFQATPRMYFGYNQLSAVMGAQLWLSADGESFNLVDQSEPFIISGIFKEALPLREPGYMEEDVQVYLMPTSPFNANTPTYCQTTQLDDISQAARGAGQAIWVVGSEALAVEGLTLVGQNHYRARRMFRGWGGSPIAAVTSGALWHWHKFGGAFQRDLTEDSIGTIFHYKIVPYNFAGQLYDISSISARTYQIKGLWWLPRAQAPIDLWVNSALAWPSSTPIIGPYLGVTSGGADVILTWEEAANNAGFGAGGAGVGGFGHFTSEVSTPSYRINVFSSNGTSVSSFVANTGYFNYTLAQNSAAFNGFQGNVSYRVTPYNGKGDGPVSNSRSISLFW